MTGKTGQAMDAEGLKTKLVLGDGGMPNVLNFRNFTGAIQEVYDRTSFSEI